MRKEVNVEKLIKTFEDMAARESLLVPSGVSQLDMLIQITGTIVHVAMEDETPKQDRTLKKRNQMVQNIIISKYEMGYINDLLGMTGKEIYQKYGLKRDETITHTAKFPDDIEADIKLVICEEEKPYVEGVLFQNGAEIMCLQSDSSYITEWNFAHNETDYIVNVMVKE